MIIFCVFLPLVTMLGFEDDPLYAKSQHAYIEALGLLKKSLNEKDQVIVDAYNQPLWYFYFNFGFPERPWIGLPSEQFSINKAFIFFPAVEDTVKFIVREHAPDQNIWLITEKRDIPMKVGYKEQLINAGFKVRVDTTFFHAGEWPIVNLVKFEY